MSLRNLRSRLLMYSSNGLSTGTYGARAMVRTILPKPAKPAAATHSSSPAASGDRNHRSARLRARARSARASSPAASRSSTTGPNSGVCQSVGDVSAPSLACTGSTPATRPSRRTASTLSAPDPKALCQGSIHPGRRNGGAPVRSASSSHADRISPGDEWTSTDSAAGGRRARRRGDRPSEAFPS